MTLTVRPAREDDLDFLAWVMLTAARSHLPRSVWEIMFDRDADWTGELLRAAARSDQPHWCHLDRFWVAQADGAPIAAMSSFDPLTEGNDALSAALVPAAFGLGLQPDELPAVLARSEAMEAASPKVFPHSWGAENVAVLPEHRGRGTVEALFEVVYGHGRAAGRDCAQILCLNGNERGLKAWMRNGFELRGDYRSRPCDDIFGSPGLKLLVRQL